MNISVCTTANLKGTVTVPGDKSISHRALLLGALAKGETYVRGFLPGEDCLATMNCLNALGVDCWQPSEEEMIIQGRGSAGFSIPEKALDAQNSGTTIRLLLGMLAGQPLTATLTGDKSLQKRPMARVTVPLIQMGAKISGAEGAQYPPLTIAGGQLVGIDYHSPVASAQVKSALLLAGLQAQGETRVTEPALSRDHTERMLTAFGVDVKRQGLSVSLTGGQEMVGTKVVVPGDISSAAFLLVAGLLVPEGQVRLMKVGVNPTRSGILDVLVGAGAQISIDNQMVVNGEPVADLTVRSSKLRGFKIGGDLIPRLVDELPILALAATQAQGTTYITDAQELKVKETNRLEALGQGLKALGATVEMTDSGMIIYGPTPLQGTKLSSGGDHRMAMTWAVAGLVARGTTFVSDCRCVAVSFPGFFQRFRELGGQLTGMEE